MASGAAATAMAAQMELLLHHVVLPPRLPSRAERSLEAVELAMVDRMIGGVRQMVAQLPEKRISDAWEALRRSLQAYKLFHSGGKLIKGRLLSALRELQPNDLIIVYVLEQNAALIIRRDTKKQEYEKQGDVVIFEAFETSAKCEDVLAAGPALEWTFPGCSISMVFSDFDDPSFQDELVNLLDKASTESIKSFAPRAHKSGTTVFESRDTVDPTMITQILMTLLEALGKRIYPILTRKRVRDEVNWSDGALKPWRRSPVWLVLRVSIQRYLSTVLGDEAGRCHFKFLMCLMAGQLLQDAQSSLPEDKVDLVHFLKSKLCRRVAKLKIDMEGSSQDCKAGYTFLFEKLEPIFEVAERAASAYVNSVFSRIQNAPALGCREVRDLPYHAEKRDLQMSLLNSSRFLRRALEDKGDQTDGFSGVMPLSFDLSVIHKKAGARFVNQCFTIFKMEEEIEGKLSNHSATSDYSSDCIILSRIIADYIKAVGNTYQANAEQISIMILNIMDLWVLMDRCALRAFPLLRDYNPCFTSELLDILQLWRIHDMDRLLAIRTYLLKRTKESGRLNIFSDPRVACFAERCYDESIDSDSLRELRARIEWDAKVNLRMKKEEWEKKTEKYKELSRQISELTCLYEPGIYGDVHSKQCTKCYLGRQARRIQIEGFEHPLPTSEIQTKAIIFELGCPPAFAEYRKTMWMILKLAFSNLLNEGDKSWLLADYTELKPYSQSSNMPRGFSLGSKKKSWLTTHYSKNIRFPVQFEDICHPNGMLFNYVDLSEDSPNRPSEQKVKPSFSHLFGLQIPRSSPFWPLRSAPQFAADAPGSTSYQIIANQGLCPATLNVHEYMSYLALSSARALRWPQLLIEIGSNNLNFGSEALAVLVRRLALQVGPYSAGVHAVFQDRAFCQTLLEQIDQRLDALTTNWREIISMETMITLALRLFSLCTTSVRQDALDLVYNIRKITISWITQLRMEFVNATDADAIRRSSNYGLWVAILCRRTFEVHCHSDLALTGSDTQHFLEATMMMQDNLVRDPLTMDVFLKNALIRDFQMVYHIRHILRGAVTEHPGSVVDALVSAWPIFETSRTLSKVEFLHDNDRWWIMVELPPTMFQFGSLIHVHLLQGHLLLNGSSIGRLPPEWTASGLLETLFGTNTNLLTYPSQMYGMTYALAVQISGHSFHLGFRDGELIVRAYFRDTVLEFIPRSNFQTLHSGDLPASLVDDCVHWLDLNSGILEVRPAAQKWKQRPGNWFLNVRSGRVTRRKTTLVDTRCGLFTRISNLFTNFELPRNLLVYQPDRGQLVVVLPRLELSFFVNSRSLLESRQLRAEFDRDQNAGVWYGLVSKIVLKAVIPSSHSASIPQKSRSIIVPIGALTYKRVGPHVRVHLENDDTYVRFSINDVLGRLECAVEPRIIYVKAMLHAYTSSFLPDPLTRRTGVDEAVHCLSAGYSQPWSPLTVAQNRALPLIASLTPKRGYYPKHLKVMQTILWDEKLPTIVQDGRFRALIDSIQQKSKDLALFAKDDPDLPDLEDSGDFHLIHRAQCRLYATSEQIVISNKSFLEDTAYSSRDKVQESHRTILQITNTLLDWPSQLHDIPDVVSLLHSLPQPSTLAGFFASPDKPLLTDMLEVEFRLAICPLITFCQNLKREDKYKAMFWFAVVAYDHGTDLDSRFLKILLAFTIFSELKQSPNLTWPSYEGFQREQLPTLDRLTNIVRGCYLKYTRDPGDVTIDETAFTLSSKLYRQLQALQKAYEKQQEQNSIALCQHLLSQWPCSEPNVDDFSPSTTPLLIDLDNAMILIREEWLRLFKNWELYQYLSTTQKTLEIHTTQIKPAITQMDVLELPEQEVYPSICSRHNFVGLHTLLRQLPAIKDTGDTQPLGLLKAPFATKSVLSRSHSPSSEAQQLSKIVDQLTSSSPSTVRQQYGTDLRESLEALETCADHAVITPQRPFNLKQHHADMTQAQKDVSLCLASIVQALEGNTVASSWLQRASLWPAISPVTVLENLRSAKVKFLGKFIKSKLVEYATLITSYQRLLRIQDAHQKRKTHKRIEETSNYGHSNWLPAEHPDWLLLEIDSNLLLRPTQIDVAYATIAPSSGSNSVLQLNMGAGKTSVIMMMVSSVLADGVSLMRVIVPKALLLQTSQLMHSRLGGLIGREIRHVPFSRRTPTTVEMTKKYYQLHNSMRRKAGVMLALPEHILSFKLSGLQQLSDGCISEARVMIDAQDWFSQYSRDVIDEADSILAIRTQLIYPSGAQKTVDGHPHRWLVPQMLLHQVLSHLYHLQTTFPHSIEVFWRSYGSFPVVSFVRKDAEDDLLRRLVDDIHGGRTPILPQDLSRSERDLIKHFITEPKISLEEEQVIREMFPDKPAAKQAIFLLRGLIVHRILLMTLKKRWNVQYGLSITRDPIAIPYVAKGTPSEYSEFGHSDVAILFTCLSFYYQGLSEEQFRQTLEHAAKADDPAQIYDRFTVGTQLDWNSINIDDKAQIRDIWMQARSSMAIVDYFLNNKVFPLYARQFKMKLQTSGWDLPLFSSAQKTTNPSLLDRTFNQTKKMPSEDTPQPLSTGFSGTNDWKRMLPLTICQKDLPSLAHTNAEVLTYLLQPRNKRIVRASDENGGHLTEHGLLQLIHSERIRVLIDAGAAILEMTNLDLVKAWLEIDTDALAAVYFNDDNKAMIWYRTGYSIPLIASTFADDLQDCLVYLDEAHTRGTDLKIPSDAVGALTLGLRQTKDHTVQAAMRLRELKDSQSIRFFIPPGVLQSIMDLRDSPTHAIVDSTDVIYWLLVETCDGIEQLQPLYFSQGVDFCHRSSALLDNPEFLSDEQHRETLLKSLRQVELQSLERMYGVSKTKASAPKLAMMASSKLKAFMHDLKLCKKSFQDTGNAVHGSALQEVEQEREEQREVETVREVQKQVIFKPHGWPGLHHDIEHFVNTGRLTADSAGYELAFVALERTTLGKKYRLNGNVTSGRLFASKQFFKTVNLPHGLAHDNFQRDVCWMLWSTVNSTAMILIPEEAEETLKILNKTSPVHLIAYCAQFTRKMLHNFGGLRYFAKPSLPSNWIAPMWLKVELGLFSGRLYFDYIEYDSILTFLSISANLVEEDNEDEDAVPSSGPESDDADLEVSEVSKVSNTPKFVRKPLTFLGEWLALRRKGQDYSLTPMGYISQGKPLLATHPFFAKDSDISKEGRAAKAFVGNSAVEIQDDDAGHGFLDEEHHFEGMEQLKDTFDYSELDKEERLIDEDNEGEEALFGEASHN